MPHLVPLHSSPFPPHFGGPKSYVDDKYSHITLQLKNQNSCYKYPPDVTWNYGKADLIYYESHNNNIYLMHQLKIS